MEQTLNCLKNAHLRVIPPAQTLGLSGAGRGLSNANGTRHPASAHGRGLAILFSSGERLPAPADRVVETIK